ncbi:sensor histidine kinase [Nocardia sp. CC227C]|uniref:sensor histidine kinase n=1 Tax=Nocardia sp. CC227C TaxID=3044562 RepID=UPI00278C774D|nr:sensor histidine kinase [Nocardia sp. CC227C]
MEAAPRSWQFSLSNWPVTRKVGIVLVLPVLLASTFAVLRINGELQTINQLSTGTEQAVVFDPTIKFESATQELAVAAITGFGNPAADPVIDTATTKFDQAAADLETVLRTAKPGAAVTDELTQTLAIARSMRNSLRTGSAQAIGEQADTVSGKIQNALSTSQSVADLRVQQLFLQMGTVMTANRLLTQERIMLATPGAGTNPALRTRLLTAIGAEVTMLEVYRGMQPEQAAAYTTLKDAAQARIGILMQNVSDPMAVPAMTESINTSVDAYHRESTGLAAALDENLAALSTEARNNVLRDTSIVIGMLLAGLAIALVVARSLVVPVRRLRRDALQVAHIDLPQELEVVRSGGTTPEINPVDVHTTEEIGQLARAVDDIHAQALHLAGEQARLRLQIGNMFETLSRRSQSLVEQQLNLIEELERDEDDSERLQSLFRLDHLATRMRRNGDNLLVLAGTALRRGHLPPVPLSDMLWSSVSQVEDYQRVEIGTVPDGIVAGEPAVDIEHLLAELIDNALRYSPPSTPVAVSVARAVDGGYLIEITDRGLGMNAEDLQSINDRLASGGEVNVETARRMGLFVVGRLAKRHNITVSLRRTSAMVAQPGITASVHLPGSLVSPAPERNDSSTGSYPLTGTLPVAPALPLHPQSQPAALNTQFTNLSSPITPPATPAIAPPRLMPVPNPPESTPRFGVTSSGLPQRRPPASEPVEPPPSDTPREVPAEPTPVDFWGENREWDNNETQQYQASDVEAWGLAHGGGRNQPAPGSAAPTGGGQDFNGQDFNGQDATGQGLSGQGRNGQGFNGFENADSGRNGVRDNGFAPARPSAAGDDGFAGGGNGTATPGNGFVTLGGNGRDNGGNGTNGSDDTSGSGTEDTGRDSVVGTVGNGSATGGTGSSGGGADPGSPRPNAVGAPNAATPNAATPNAASPNANGAAERPPAAPRPPAPAQALRPVGEAPTPIYQRMVSEWLVEPAVGGQTGAAWTSSSDAGWAAAEQAMEPAVGGKTQGGLPIRRPGAQLVPGAAVPADEEGARNPEEIRHSLTRHLSGVLSGRADAQHKDGAPYNDGGHA